MKKLLLFFGVMVLLTGCGAFQKSEDIKNEHNKSLKNTVEGVQRSTPLGISYDYYMKCKEEYRYRLEYGELIAENNGIIITIAKSINEDIITDLSFQAKKENKKELLNEINTVFKMSGMREISMNEFDEISNSSTTRKESEAIDSGNSIESKSNKTLTIDDINIMKYASDEAPNGLYWSIVLSKTYEVK